MDVKELIEQYGPVKAIWREREAALLAEGKAAHILTIVGSDVSFEELPEDQRPTDEELKDRGEDRDTHTGWLQHGFVGHRLVNVCEIFETEKPMPMDLEVQDVWYGEDGLPNS